MSFFAAGGVLPEGCPMIALSKRMLWCQDGKITSGPTQRTKTIKPDANAEEGFGRSACQRGGGYSARIAAYGETIKRSQTGTANDLLQRQRIYKDSEGKDIRDGWMTSQFKTVLHNAYTRLLEPRCYR